MMIKLVGRRTLLGWFGAALVGAPFLPKIAYDGFAINSVPNPVGYGGISESELMNLLVQRTERWYHWPHQDIFPIYPDARGWEDSRGRIGFDFEDGSALMLPPPAREIFHDIEARKWARTAREDAAAVAA